MFKDYLKLLIDFRDAWKAGDWKKCAAIAIEIQKIILGFFTSSGVGTMSVVEGEQLTRVTAEIKELIESTAIPADVDGSAWGDGKLIAWLIKIGLIVIGIPVPFESK